MSRPYHIHIRPFNVQTNCKGGITISVRGDEDRGFIYGVARCSLDDNYNKAYGRALSTIRLNEPARRMHLPDDLKSMRDVEQHLRSLYKA